MTGKYVVIEGIDGAGKSTLHASLKKAVEVDETLAEKFVFTKEPYASKYIKLLKPAKDPIERAAIFVADRCIHMREVVLPALKEGKIVVSDRSYISNLIYQSSEIEDPVRAQQMMHKIMMMQPDYLPKVRLFILLDVDIPDALNRADQKKNKFTPETEEMLTRAKKAYMDLLFLQNSDKSASMIFGGPWPYDLMAVSYYTEEEVFTQIFDELVGLTRKA